MSFGSLRYIAVGLLLSSFSRETSALEVTLCENAIPPWVIEENGKIDRHSLLSLFTNKVFSKIPEIQIRYELLPWKRCQDQVEQGKVDGALLMGINEERKKLFQFSTITLEYPEGFIYSKRNFPNGIRINSFDDLKKFRIGLLRGHKYHEELLKLMNQQLIDYEILESSEQNIKMLISGRVDVAIDGLINARYYISQEYLQDKLAINEGTLVIKKGMAYAFSRKSPIIKYLPEINRQIELLRKSNFHTYLLERDYTYNSKYGGRDINTKKL